MAASPERSSDVPKLTARRFLVTVALTVAVVLVAAWLTPSNAFLFIPNDAEPLADRVSVPGEKPGDGRGGIYFVDVSVRRATWLERLAPFVRPDGTSLVAEDIVVPPGSSFAERRQTSLAEMDRSQEVATAVALRAAGHEVRARPEGALVDAIDPRAPAARALRAGDVILEAAGRAVRTPGALRRAVGTVRPGEAIALRVRRGRRVLELTVTTIAAPDEPRRPVIGIRVTQAADIDLPLDIDIDLGNVGGPSAGLPFALDILQELGRDIDRGYKVAATGEIELDGTVAPIGGVKQKVFGVRAAGADIFLVPAGDNAEEARRYAGNLRVIGVENFQQALRALATLPLK